MGFRINMGATTSCRFNNGYLEVDWPIPLKCKTSVKVNTDWQCNTFRSPWVYFTLWDGFRLYVGLKNGLINVIDAHGMLLAVHTWDPGLFTICEAGYWKEENGNVHIVKSLIEEPRLLLVEGAFRTFVLNEGLTATFYDPRKVTGDARDSMNLLAIQGEIVRLGCMLMGGEMVNEEEHGHWEVDPFASTHDLIWF